MYLLISSILSFLLSFTLSFRANSSCYWFAFLFTKPFLHSIGEDISLRETDAHCVCALLVMYLSYLPDPIIPVQCYDTLIHYYSNGSTAFLFPFLSFLFPPQQRIRRTINAFSLACFPSLHVSFSSPYYSPAIPFWTRRPSAKINIGEDALCESQYLIPISASSSWRVILFCLQ